MTPGRIATRSYCNNKGAITINSDGFCPPYSTANSYRGITINSTYNTNQLVTEPDVSAASTNSYYLAIEWTTNINDNELSQLSVNDDMFFGAVSPGGSSSSFLMYVSFSQIGNIKTDKPPTPSYFNIYTSGWFVNYGGSMRWMEDLPANLTAFNKGTILKKLTVSGKQYYHVADVDYETYVWWNKEYSLMPYIMTVYGIKEWGGSYYTLNSSNDNTSAALVVIEV